MATWTIAAAQIDCRLAEPQHNLAVIRDRLHEAVRHGARLVVFPECALTGYCFESRDEALAHAQPLPGPASEAVAADCRRLDAWAAFGLLERDERGRLFNACALVGPSGLAGVYRKVHLPVLGVDRFTTPGDRPFAVHDLGGLRVGLNICYDGSFPEAARVLTLLGADLVALPTNWPTGAYGAMQYLVPARALENHVYYLACNRVGDEGGFHFIGHSRVADCGGQLLASAGEGEELLLAEIDPARARDKQVVNIPGRYEVNRVTHRRPEMYGPLCRGHEKTAGPPGTVGEAGG